MGKAAESLWGRVRPLDVFPNSMERYCKVMSKEVIRSNLQIERILSSCVENRQKGPKGKSRENCRETTAITQAKDSSD